MLGGIDLTKKNQGISLIFVAMIFFAIFINCLTVEAQDVLEITGPAAAFEGEEVEFTVTLNGDPAQARVVFETVSPAKFSDQTTGTVNFTMPLVPYGDEEYIVTASILELTASHTILVKNKTGVLEIELSQDYIVEMDEFTVTVKDEDEPTVGANVWFNSDVYTTDTYGNVTLTAPDVLVTTNYKAIVNKTGYRLNSTMVTINEADLGLKLMEVINPSIVEPGEENIEINVISKYGGLENVTIDVYYEGQRHSEHVTDNNGTAYITAPSINNNHYFLIYVSKDGYDMYSAEGEIKVSLFARELSFDLEISFDSSEVYEGDSVTVEVTDDVGFGVEGVSIWRGAIELDEITDSEGISAFIAPSVFMDREYFIYGIKEGYNFAEGRVTVRDKGSEQGELIVEIDSTVNESDVFFVYVKDSDLTPVEDVIVTFNSEQMITDEDGAVYFVAPEVNSNTFYTVEASKYGYLPTSASVEVINADVSNGGSSNELVIYVVGKIMENEEFTVVVRDNKGNLVSNAQVKFMDTYLDTDHAGSVTFTAPDVSWNEIKEIVVTKSGYESASKEITIKSNEEFPYWYLVIAVIIILIIGVVAYFRYGMII